jgi:hypothetical protein
MVKHTLDGDNMTQREYASVALSMSLSLLLKQNF